MNDMLAITADPDSDDVLVSELAGSKADRVTVLIAGCHPEHDSDSAVRLVELVRRVELVSGAAVTGLAGDPAESITTSTTAWCTRPRRPSIRC